MKPYLPHKLLAALLAAVFTPALTATEPATNLGNVMYVGDSITHGVNSASWRWAMHKIFVDNGISYTPVGYKTGNNSGGVANGTTYCGEAFANVHSAQSSARAWEVAGRKAGGRFDNTNLRNWLGQSTTKTGGGTYTGATYDVDTFYLLIGTNDLLSDSGGINNAANLESKTTYLLGEADANGVRSGGDMKTILDSMYTEKADAPVVILSIPCWTRHANSNGASYHTATQTYNTELEAWIANYNATNGKDALYVDVNKGMVDVASSTPFYGCETMFGNPGVDGLHPSAHGDLIMAGAVAKAQGYAGRTAGQQRMAASEFAHQAGDFTLTSGTLTGSNITLDNNGTATLNWTEGADLTHGFTVDFTLPNGLGNGATDGWSNGNLAVTMGNGVIGGTLNISEAYIKWGDSILYSLDMSGSDTSTAYTVFDKSEAIRVAYVIGNTEANLSSGFYVWMDDMLIGEACGISGTSVNGVSITNGTGSSVTLSGLAATEHAYAPTTTRVTVSNNVIEPYIPDVSKDTATKAWTSDSSTSVNLGDGAATTANSNIIIGAGSTGTISIINANTTPTDGTTWIDVTGAAVSTGFSQIVGNGATHTGNVNYRIDDQYQNTTTWGTIFSTNNGKVDGNLYMEFSGATVNIANGTYSGTSASVAGGYNSNGVTGAVTMVFNAGTFGGGIWGGSINGRGDFGSTDLHVFGGSFGGDIYAGGVVGTISGDTSVILTGDAYELTGGSKTISAGGTGGTIQGGTTLTIKDMGTDTSGEGKGIANYAGNLTLSGTSGATVTGQKKLAFVNSTHDNFRATLSNFDAVELTESDLTITGGLGGATVLKLDKDSSLTLNAGTYGEMQVASSGAITLKGGSSMTLSQTNNDQQIVGTFEVQQASALGLGTGYNTGSTYSVKDGGMLSMANGATLLNGGAINLESGSIVNVLDGATATIEGDISGDLKLAGSGTLVLAEGTATTLNSLRGGALVNNRTLTIGDIGPLSGTLVNSGDLTITGRVSMPQDLSNLTHIQLGLLAANREDFTSTLGYAAGEAVSGYYMNAYILIGSDGGTLNTQGATMDEGIVDDVEGFLFVQAADNVYHINEDATYSTHDAYGVTSQGHTVQVEDGYTLTLDRSVQNGVKLATVGDGAVSLASGTTEISLGAAAATLQNVYVGEGNEATVAHSTVESTGIRVDDGGLLHVNVTNTNNLTFNISKLSGEGTVELSNSTNNNVVFSGANAPAAFNGTLVLDGKSWNCFDSTTWNFTEIDGKYASLHINNGGRGVALGNYKTEAGALNIGNLSGSGDISPSYGDAGSHYLAVHQNKETIYSGSAQKDTTRNISILKYGDANLILSGANTSNGALKVKEGMLTFTTSGSWAGATTVEDGATLAYIGGARNYTGNITMETGSTLRVLGAGTLADTEFAAGNLTFASNAAISKLVVDEGASATVNANTTLTIGATMQIDGTFTNNGTVAVTSLANLDAIGGTQYVDRISPTSGNGYETAVYSVYTGNGTVTGLSSLSIAGSETSYEIDSAGQVRVGESSGRYFINQGTVVYGGTDNVAASDTTQFLVLNGGTLELAQALKDGHTVSLAVDNATLKIREGVVQGIVTVNRPGATLTLAGDGVYDIGTARALNSQVVMGDDWRGAISITGYAGGLNVKDLAKDGSRVRFAGVNGWLAQAYATIARDVELVDTEDAPALNVTAMSASFNYGFSGKVTGDGTIKFSGGGASNNDLNISGDITGWTGKFEEAGTAARRIKFSGNATTINAAVEHTGSAAFTVKIDNNSNVAVNNSITNAQGADAMTLALSGTGTKTFADNVAVTTLTTAGGAATFDGTLKAGTLTADADVTISSTANATLGNVNVNAGTLALNGTTVMTGTLTNSGTVALGASANTTFNNVTVNTGSSMTFAAGTTVQVNGTFNVADGLSVGGVVGSAGHVATGNAAAQTQAQSNSNLITFVGGDNLVKTGTGSLVVKGYVTLGNTTINEGVLQVQTTTGTGGARLGNVTLNGGELSLYATDDVKATTHNIIDSLTVRSNSVLSATWARALTDIKALTFENNSTLVLEDSHSNGSNAVYYIGGDYAGKGTVEVQQANNGNNRHTGVTLQSEEALRDAVVNYSTIASNSANNAIAVGLNNVKVAGLESGSSANFTNRLCLISQADAVNSLTASDGSFRTLTITGDGAEHIFYGKVLGNLNITMGDGANTETGSVQKFMGNNSAFNGAITVEKGSLVFGSAVGTATAIAVNGGSLSLAGGTTSDLSIAGDLTLTAGTLTVNQVFAVSDTGSFTNNGTLALGANSIIDLTGMAGEAVGNNYAYRIMAADSTGSVTGLDTLDISRIRANGLGWESASYANGVITLVRSGAMLEWNTTDALTWTQTTAPTGFHPIGGAADATQASTATSNVSFNETTTVNLGEDITVAGLGVDENKHLTVAANSHTLNAKTINLENGATLTIDNAALDYTGTTGIDLSTGSTLELTGAAMAGYDHQILRGDGTLKLALTADATNTVKTGTAFTGTVHVTSGQLSIADSVASTGATTWELDDGVNAVLSSSGTNNLYTNLVLNGKSQLTVDGTTNFYGAINGSHLEKTGAGALNFQGDTALDKLTAGSGSITTGTSSSLEITSSLDNAVAVTIGGKFVGGENFYKTGDGTLTLNSSARLTLPMLDIQGGSVIIKTNTQDLSIGTVKLGSGRTLSNFSEGFPVREIAVSQLTMAGNATLKTENFGGMWKVDGLTLAGNTLTLQGAHASDAWTVYNFSGTQTANDTGTVSVQQAQDGDKRHVLVKISGEEALRSAELSGTKIVNRSAANNRIVFSLATDNVQVGALSTGATSGTGAELTDSTVQRVILVSNAKELVGEGRITDNTYFDTAGDGLVRTLTINGTGATTAFAGTVGANIKIVMGNATTDTASHQKFMGDITAFNGDVTVNKGQLTFGNALSTTGSVTVNGGALTNEAALTAAGVTLNGGTTTVGGALTTATLAVNDGTLAINGGATVSGLTGTAATAGITAATAQTLTITGEGGTYAGGIGANVNIVMADTATGTQIIGGSMADFNGDVTVNAGTLQLSSGATVGTLTLVEGAAITDSGTLSVSNLSAAAGGAINNTSIVYTGTADTTIAAFMDGGSLEVATDAGLVTLTGATKNLENLTIRYSNQSATGEDDILIDADVTVSGTITLENNSQIGFGDNRQLSWNGFTYTTDADSNTKGTISKAGADSAVTVSNMRIMSTVDEEHEIGFKLDNVRLVNTAGTATLTATGNTLSDVVVSGGKVVLAENTTVTNDVNLAVQSAQLEVAAGKTLTNGVVTLKGANGQKLLIDNTTANASVFYGNGEASAAIISGAEVTVNAAASPDQNYTWGAQLVNSSLKVTGGSLTLHNSEMHQLSSLKVNNYGTLTVKNGSGFTVNGVTYVSDIGTVDGTVYKGDNKDEAFDINLAASTVSNMTVTLNAKSSKAGFYVGVKNVDLVRDYADSSALTVNLQWANENAREFHNVEAKQGEINFAGHAFAKGDVIVGGTGSVTVNDGKVLKVDNDVITITGTSAKAKITADTAGSSLAGADATAKVSDATLAVNNTGSETYEWGAKLENSSLTTSGDVKLTNSNSVTSLTLNAGSNLTLTGDMTAGTVSVADGATLNVVDAGFSVDKLTGGTLDLTATTPIGDHVGLVDDGGTGDLAALIDDCTIGASDVVINASGAIDAKARELGIESVYGTTLTLDIFSNIEILDGTTLTLDGMGNYSNVMLHISLADKVSGAYADLAGDGASTVLSTPYLGKVDLSEYAGEHVNVWATFTIPEPSTGVLSVLALAGLAARRRRRTQDK